MFCGIAYFQKFSAEVNVKQVYTEPIWTKYNSQRQLLAEILCTRFHRTPSNSSGVEKDVRIDMNSPLRDHFIKFLRKDSQSNNKINFQNHVLVTYDRAYKFLNGIYLVQNKTQWWLFWTQQWTSVFRKRRGISWPAERLSVSQGWSCKANCVKV